MKLMVIPGTGDPFTQYRQAYDLLVKEAYLRNTEIKILNFPGHFSIDSKSFMKIDKCVEILRDIFAKIDKNGEKWIVLCRSFGCQVFAKAMLLTNIFLMHIHKVIFWGALPYYNLYKLLVKNFIKIKKDCLSKAQEYKRIYFTKCIL